MRDDIERLRDIVAAIERIEKYVPHKKLRLMDKN